MFQKTADEASAGLHSPKLKNIAMKKL